MNNMSFFKLPITLVVIYWFMGTIYSIVMLMIRASEHITLLDNIVNILVNSLLYGLPKFLLMMVIASLALYRCYIHKVTIKNVLCLGIVALIIVVIIRLLYQFIGAAILSYSFEHFYNYHMLTIFCYQLVMNVLSYLVIGLVGYYGVLSLQSVFDRDLNTSILNQSNSAKIHLTLFILLWLFIYLLFLMPLLSYSGYSYLYEYRDLTTIFCLVLVMVIIVIVYFIIKNCFSCAFATLQISRIVKSSILSFVLSGIVNAIISVGMIFIVIIIAFGSYYGNNDSTIMFVILLGVILQLVLTCLIIRAVTKRYFSITFNESTL